MKRPRALPAGAAALLFLAAALALYWSGLRNPLLFDDGHLQEYWLRTKYMQAALHFASRWVSDTTFALVYLAFGYNTVAQRVFNLVAHAAVATALFALVTRLQPDRRGLAFGGALLFLLHPVAVYGVGYLIQRSIVLATLFSVLTLICVLEAQKRRGWYAAAVVLYVLAVFSKEHAVMLPAVALALVVLVRGVSWPLVRNLAVAALPFALVGLYMAFQARSILGTAYEPFAADTRVGTDASYLYPLSILNQSMLFFRYLGTWLLPWPGWMAIDIRVPFPRGLADPVYLLTLAAWLGWAGAAVWLLLKRGRAGLAGFAMLFPWLLALTEMAVVRVQEPFVLYRSYLWMSVPLALLPLFAASLAPRVLAAAIAVFCVAFVPIARDRLDSMSSTLKAWEDALRKQPAGDVPYVERAYVGRGLAFMDERRMLDADADFTRALALNPKLPEAWLGRATVHLRSGRFREAEADLDRALLLEPRYGGAYHKRCLVKLTTGRTEDALKDCEQARTLGQRDHELFTNLGVVYRQLGRREEAEASYRHSLEIAPKYPSTHYNYGVLLLDAGRLEEARPHFEVACKARIATACALLRGR
jgi:protein O-mannosyl-transferase